ncbi:hypothetical protein E2C01_078359 [Portunus trituberculatus]|uniref:Uncharacterized protein n=1 Tax=Portunus trituberculatus TaxID=210409 RepID=A0A5B7IMR6_PORTR|nr:hypothetical protein [Portunus trituberculatus]
MSPEFCGSSCYFEQYTLIYIMHTINIVIILY